MIIGHYGDLPPEATGEKEWIKEHGFRPALVIPMFYRGTLYGALGLYGKVEEERDWPPAFVALLSAVAYNIMAVIERKHTEQALQDSEEKLIQSQKMEAVGRLAGGIAHDFNNLLTTILGYSDMLIANRELDDVTAESIQEIKASGERAASLTHQLLAFSRKQVLKPQVMNLNTVITGFVKMLNRVVGEDVQIITHLAADVWLTKADPGQMEQVIINLAVNARDAMLYGGKLVLETGNVSMDEEQCKEGHREMQPGAYVVLSISDTGEGMDEEVKEKIFEPFYTTKELGKGTGLGLSTVFGIVKQSDGYIYVYSETGKGTTFKIYLPRIEEGQEEGGETLQAQEELKGTETILIVEDESAVRKLIHRMLKTLGYKVMEAETGREALQIFKDTKVEIDLVITDTIMPGMSGKELTERLTAIQSDVKVLYISGYTDNMIVHHGVLEEGVSFLQKPFSPTTLSQKVREMLDEK